MLISGAPMVLVLDNHDSFTYNLVQYLGELGADVRVHLSDAIDVASVLRLRPSHIVISPGPGRPAAGGISIELVRAVAGRLPLLGVCLGHQAIAEAYGARVVHAPELMHGKSSPLEHVGEGLFSGLPRPLIAGRYHSLIVEEASLPDVFRVTARSREGLIMALEHRRHALYGVQFHPESILTAGGKNLLRNFLKVSVP